VWKSRCVDVQMILADFRRPYSIAEEQKVPERELNNIFRQLEVLVCSLKRSRA